MFGACFSATFGTVLGLAAGGIFAGLSFIAVRFGVLYFDGVLKGLATDEPPKAPDK